MAYCDYQNVTGKTGHEYSQSSQPTRQEVEDICEGVSLEIDGVLRAAEYELPITDADALKLLRDDQAIVDLVRLFRDETTLGNRYDALVG